MRALRRLNADAKVVFSSGYSELDIAARFASDPTFRLVEKPILSEHLLKVIRSALDAPSP